MRDPGFVLMTLESSAATAGSWRAVTRVMHVGRSPRCQYWRSSWGLGGEELARLLIGKKMWLDRMHDGEDEYREAKKPTTQNCATTKKRIKNLENYISAIGL